jgi:hypothetical protein
MAPPARLLLFLAAGALAGGCEATPPKEAQGRTVVRPALGFALDVPQGWTWRDLGGDVALEIIEQSPGREPRGGGPAEGPSRPPAGRRGGGDLGPVLHVVVVDREGAALEAWADQAIKESQELQSDLEVTGRQAARLADGREALRITLKNPRGLKPLVQTMLLAVTEKRAFGLLLTATEPSMAQAEKTLRRSLETFVVW